MRITVDLLAIAENNILLIKRAKEPFLDKLVLPGGKFEESDLSLAHACAREASEEVGLTVDPEELELLTVLDSPKGDPRPGMRVSIVYLLRLSSIEALKNAKAGSDAREIVILPISSIKSDLIGFDHFKAIKLL